MATPGDTSLIVYKILADAQQASAELKKFNVQVDESARKALMAQKLIQETSKKLGIGFNEAAQAVGKFNPMLGISQKELDTTAQKMEQVGNKGKGAFDKVLSATNILNIAFGILASTLVRNVLQAFGQMVSTALKGLNELEAAMFNIQTAEEKLSKQGVNISVTGLEKIIADIQELDPMLSKFQATELVSVLTSKVAPAARLSEKEIGNLAEVITVLAVKNQALGKSFEEVEQQVITGLLSGRVTAGINQLGAKITEQAVQEEAVKQGLVATTEAYRALNAAEKARVDTLSITAILQRENATEIQRLPDFMQTVSGLMGTARSELTDFLTSIGQILSPLIKSVLRVLIDALQGMSAWIEKNRTALTAMSSVIGKIVESEAFINGLTFAFKLLFGAITLAFTVASKMLDIINKIADRVPVFRSIIDALAGNQSPIDTPTGQFVPDTSGATEKEAEETEKAMEKLQDIMQGNADKLADIARDYGRKIEDINRDYAQKLEDITRDSARRREDAERNYGQKVEDINRSANEKIAEAQANFRQKEIDREKEYQNKLRELREKFLFDLEDALRARDARQVLRLIRQYNLDKKNLEERRKLQKKDDADELARKLADIERERVLKLEAAKREYDEKLEEIKRGEARARAEANRWHERQLSDARLWYQRQLADQREFLKRKLADLQASYAQELGMAKQFQNSLSTATVSGTPITSTPSTSYPSQQPGFGNGVYLPYDVRNIYRKLGIPGFADGGTLVARKPTLALFGEKSPEVASFQPINKGGFSASFGGTNGGAGGQMSLRISLSEGLVAEIVENSLENMATHIERTRRASR